MYVNVQCILTQRLMTDGSCAGEVSHEAHPCYMQSGSGSGFGSCFTGGQSALQLYSLSRRGGFSTLSHLDHQKKQRQQCSAAPQSKHTKWMLIIRSHESASLMSMYCKKLMAVIAYVFK